MKGTVKFFNRTKGFGFIKADEGNEEYFVHETALEENTSIDEGDSVEFEATESDRGPRATNVKLLSSADSAEHSDVEGGLASLDE